MVTAIEVGLRIIEVSAILLPLMGILMQVYIRYVVQGHSRLTYRQVWAGYLALSITTLSVALAGVAAVIPFLSASTPLALLIPLALLYVGFGGIAITVIIIAGLAMAQEERPVQQALLSHWRENIDDE